LLRINLAARSMSSATAGSPGKANSEGEIMNRFLLGASAGALALGLVGFAGAALSADIVEAPAYDWTGFYVGLQGGYAWGDNDADIDFDPNLVVPPTVDSIDIDGWLGGIHAGYLWQSDSLVFGIEGDGEFADIDGDADIQAGGQPIGKLEQDIDWLASLRLRAGFAVDRLLIYATGGVAVGGVEISTKHWLFAADSSNKDTEWGWTVGGGLEYAFSDDLSARIEYRYTDLGDTSTDVGGDLGTVDFEAENTLHAVRVGLSWHL
jgi:outer membrane immunogenic protein